ncbi:MAG: chemotaxis protein CheB [Cryobacterium sp.]|nr:chemotaxis protein CheB [Oligoflexia bacterium]
MPENHPILGRAIAIGVSAGGVDVLNRLFKNLPRPFPIPIFVTLHVSAHAAFIPEAFHGGPGLVVKESEDKEEIRSGHVYFAAADYHLLVEKTGRLSFSSEEPVHYSRPSSDVMLESAAETYGRDLLGIVLTGANDDGASGLAIVKAEGGRTIVQDPATATSDTMPKAALKLCAPDEILSPEEIAASMIRWGEGK